MLEHLYGRNPVYECLRAGRRDVLKIWIARGVNVHGVLGQVIDLADKRQVPVQWVERQQIDRLAAAESHQGVMADVGSYPYATVQEIMALAAARGEPPWLLVLDSVQDPQNLGALARTAEVVGVHGILIPDHRAAAVTPAVVNVSSGATEHLLIAQVTNLVRQMEALKRQEVWFAGLEDVPQAQILWQANLDGPLGLVIGSEGEGMRRLVREACDWMIRLPMRGLVGSLNAATAGSIALYEMARQRKIGQSEEKSKK